MMAWRSRLQQLTFTLRYVQWDQAQDMKPLALETDWWSEWMYEKCVLPPLISLYYFKEELSKSPALCMYCVTPKLVACWMYNTQNTCKLIESQACRRHCTKREQSVESLIMSISEMLASTTAGMRKNPTNTSQISPSSRLYYTTK